MRLLPALIAGCFLYAAWAAGYALSAVLWPAMVAVPAVAVVRHNSHERRWQRQGDRAARLMDDIPMK